MDTLHKHTYSIETAMCSLVPSSGPVLCRDEMEEWSASEANLFEEALDKYGKDFTDIRQDFVSTYRKIDAKHLFFLERVQPAIDSIHFNMSITRHNLTLSNSVVAVENIEEYRWILLHVEDNWPLRPAETLESRRGRI